MDNKFVSKNSNYAYRFIPPKKKSKTPTDTIQSLTCNKVNNPYVKRQIDKEKSDEQFFSHQTKAQHLYIIPKMRLQILTIRHHQKKKS